MTDQIIPDSTVKKAPEKKNGPMMAIILLLLIGLAAMAFLWSKKNSELNECSQVRSQLESDINGMNKMMEGYVGDMTKDLKTDFRNMLDTYDNMEITSQEQADSIQFQKDKIYGLLEDIEKEQKKNRMSAHTIMNLRKENETMKKIMRGYIVQIDSLNTLNVKLNTDLDQTTNQLNSAKEERDQAKDEAAANAEKVKEGSRLQAFGFNSGGLRMKLNSTTEPTSRAKSCVQIQSSFTLSANPIAKAGNKMVYLQVINPDGKTLQSRSSNVLQSDGGAIAYSDKKEVNYKNQQLDMTIYYDLQNEPALKGNYKVKIYCDGVVVGSDSFLLK